MLGLKHQSGFFQSPVVDTTETTIDSSKLNLLLLSGSKASGGLPPDIKAGYLDFAEDWIKDHFAESIASGKPILFVPYARPDGDTEQDYFEFVKARVEKMGITLECAPEDGITAETLAHVGGIFVGGGHTYTLLSKLQRTGSLAIINEKVRQGLPYMGSSAGTLIACPDIGTTNDMPFTGGQPFDPRSFGFLDFQLNCHYTEGVIPGHNGETRIVRLREGSSLFPDMPPILGLYEGTAIKARGHERYILNSRHATGLNPPIYHRGERTEIECVAETAKCITGLLIPKQVASSSFNP